MKKIAFYGLYMLMLIGLGSGLFSCKEDVPPAKPKLSFGEKQLTFKESDGEVEIQVLLDKAADQDIQINYTISGTAGEQVKVGSNVVPDYKINSDYLEVLIAKGETAGIIRLEFLSDGYIEDDETIEIQIDDVTGTDIEITRDDEVNITLQQEDGLVVVLEWGVGTGEKYLDVDMDLFLWAQDNVTSTLGITGFGSLQGSVVSPEWFFLPTALLTDGTYGLSCTYYSGTVEPMNFQVSFIKLVNGANASTTVKKGTYTLANINPWDDATIGTDPSLAMTFKKVGADYNTFSEITIPVSGSRIISSQIPLGLKRK